MHLKFSLQLGQGPMFVNKDIAANPSLEVFKAEIQEVKVELAAQRAKQEAQDAKLAYVLENQQRMSAKQEEMASDLKSIITLLLSKP
jgi:hypothetical protein